MRPGLDAVSLVRHYGGMPRQASWEKIGVSRATWYRHGKPAEKPRKGKTVPEIAKEIGVSSTRTYYRTMRALNSELAPLVVAGQLSAAQADRMLGGDPQHLRRFLALLPPAPDEERRP
jgi:hypothetical protein